MKKEMLVTIAVMVRTDVPGCTRTGCSGWVWVCSGFNRHPHFKYKQINLVSLGRMGSNVTSFTGKRLTRLLLHFALLHFALK